MRSISVKNRASWDAYAVDYGRYTQTEEKLRRVTESPQSAFAPETWALLSRAFPSMAGARVCVPSSGDNLAVLAFASLGARVTSCDISQGQLDNAAAAAVRLGLAIDFVRADTMALEGIPSGAFDLVYTSNGVHVWIDDLAAMYESVARVLRPGGFYALYEIHPFQRPFDGGCLTALKVVKPYDATGPFDKKNEVTFAWRVQDILGAMLDAGLCLRRMEELQPRVNYEAPDWVPCERLVEGHGHDLSRAEVERMYDWRVNPQAALPNLFTLLAQKM